LNDNNPPRKWTKDEIVAAIKDCAAKLGRVPLQRELRQHYGLLPTRIQRVFGTYSAALKAGGLEARGPGYTADIKELFREWAGMVREAGKPPTRIEYQLRSKYSVKPLCARFGGWAHVTLGMVQYALENNLEGEWGDVLETAKRHHPRGPSKGSSMATSISTSTPRILRDRPVYGAPLIAPGMAFSPVNEMGVVFLFGAMASRLGFMVTWIGPQYPDGEAFREVEQGGWQRVRVEFEFNSRNFLSHSHDPAECDLIVCWEHNWVECPLEVLELKKALSGQQPGSA
jgi:Homing endonuclease associated repeat